jgi:hypothetical protein
MHQQASGGFMKTGLISGILAAGFAASSAHANTPMMDAFSDFLGSCWTYHGEGRMDPIYSATEPVPNVETYCLERMENHFIRIRRRAPGPHGGAFYNEEILNWNTANQNAVTVMFTSFLSRGHINYRNAIFEDGRVTIQIRPEEDDGSDMNLKWSRVEGDQVSLVVEQYLGEDYGGWVAGPEHIYTRQDASVGPALAAEMTGSPSFSPATELFLPLLGGCFDTRFGDSDVTDTHCFTDLLGRYVRDRHIIPGDPDYSGETLFYYEPETETVDFYYYNSIGGLSSGVNVHAANGIAYERESYRGPNGEWQEFRGRYEDISYNGYISVTEELQGEEWVEVSRQEFRRVFVNPFAPTAE